MPSVVVFIALVSCCSFYCYRKHKSSPTKHGDSETVDARYNAFPMEPSFPLNTEGAQGDITPPHPAAYPTAYSRSPQQPPAPYPTTKPPPALYASDAIVPLLSTQEDVDSEREKGKLYLEAPPFYSEISQYPSYAGGPAAHVYTAS